MDNHAVLEAMGLSQDEEKQPTEADPRVANKGCSGGELRENAERRQTADTMGPIQHEQREEQQQGQYGDQERQDGQHEEQRQMAAAEEATHAHGSGPPGSQEVLLADRQHILVNEEDEGDEVAVSRPEEIHDVVALARLHLRELQEEFGIGNGTGATQDADVEAAVLNTTSAMHVVECELSPLTRRARELRVGDFAPFNGYHAIITILGRILRKITDIIVAYQQSKRTPVDRNALAEGLREHGQLVLHAFVGIVSKAAELAQHSKKDDVFFVPKDEEFQHRFMAELESTARTCFFGRHLAFYHLPPVRAFLLTVARALVSYSHGSECLTSYGAFTSSLTSWFHYMYRPEEMGKQFVSSTHPERIAFFKSFWNLLDTTMAKHYGFLVGPGLEVNDELRLPVSDSLIETTIDSLGEALQDLVTTPSEFGPQHDGFSTQQPAQCVSRPGERGRHKEYSHHRAEHAVTLPQRQKSIGQCQLSHSHEDEEWVVVGSTPLPNPWNDFRHQFDFDDVRTKCEPCEEWVLNTMTEAEEPAVNVRLLSFRGRVGQLYDVNTGATRTRGEAPSPHVILHCHGGGFVAQSSKSHEIYLRQWAKSLDCPIVSVDYSLSPEHPYPTAVEECFYVYRWILANPRQVGTTAERICLVGDSAGGNLVLAVTLKCLLEGLRPPSAVVCIYPALQLEYALSPSRLLAMLDPLLPEGILRACMEAYTGEQCERFHTTDPLLSPMTAPDKLLKCLPPVHLIAAGLDPLLDDSVAFALRLKRLGVPFHLKVFEDMPHGFLNFPRSNEHVTAAFNHCLDQLRAVLTGVIDVS